MGELFDAEVARYHQEVEAEAVRLVQAGVDPYKAYPLAAENVQAARRKAAIVDAPASLWKRLSSWQGW